MWRFLFVLFIFSFAVQSRNILTDLENELVDTRGKAEGAIDWEFGMDMYTLIYLKWTTNKDLLYSTGNSAQFSVIT